jgi:hypothetical protein
MSNEILEQVTAEVRQFNAEEITPIKERLLSLEERATSPNDQKVADLEARLDDATAKYDGLQEEVRLVQSGQQPVAAETKSEPFKGTIFKDIDETRRQLIEGETRTLTLGTTLTSTGKLESEEASAFIDHVVEQTATLSRIQTRRMRNQIANIDRLALSTQKLVAAPGETTTVADANAFTVAQRQLTTTEVVWGENISLSFLEDNIEQAGIEGHIVSLVAKQFGNDLNDLAWNGDSATGTFLAINSGFHKLGLDDSAVVDYDASGDSTAKALAAGMLKAMPSQFRTIPDLTFFWTPAAAQLYADEVAARVSGLGDATLIGGLPTLRYFGVPIVADPHVGSTTADIAMLAPASNLIFGIQRDVTYDTEWKPRERQFELTWTARIDFQHAFGGLNVLADGIVAGVNT